MKFWPEFFFFFLKPNDNTPPTTKLLAVVHVQTSGNRSQDDLFEGQNKFLVTGNVPTTVITERNSIFVSELSLFITVFVKVGKSIYMGYLIATQWRRLTIW